VPRNLARGSAIAVFVVAVAGCTGSGTQESAEPACDPPDVSPELVVEVPADGGEVTGLLWDELPAEVGTDLKIVWRVTGTGELAVRSVRPDGSAGELAFGPEPHVGSNFEAPGAEWGTGFRFDVPGCWRIELSRDDVTAQLAIPVVDVGAAP
jgi:hypothetical protein